MSVNRWVCPNCHHLNLRYKTICGYCPNKRGYLRWLLNIDNPALWLVVSGLGLLIYTILGLIFNF